MTYGYIRVSTDKQTVENQKFEITNFCKREKLRPRALFWLGFFMDGFDSIRWIAVRIFYGIG